jgi:hypothetical protein
VLGAERRDRVSALLAEIENSDDVYGDLTDALAD